MGSGLTDTLLEYDHAARALGAGQPLAPDIERNFQDRIERAEARLWPLRLGPPVHRALWRSVLRHMLAWLVLLTLMVFTVPACPPGFLLLWIGLGMWLIVAQRHARRLRRQMLGRHCPACDYDLAGLPESLPGVSAHAYGHSPVVLGTGPQVCPECGMRWPLVPRM